MTVDASALFAQLALRPDASERDVRRAYAVELKKIDQEAQPEAFQELRETYDRLLLWVRRQQAAQQAQELQQQEEAKKDAQVETETTPLLAEPQVVLDEPLSHDALAREMLQLLVRRLETRPFTDNYACAAFLAQSLDDPRLTQVDARQFYELGIANMLADGWRPGHEMLFSQAIECFGWRQDRTRLLWWGHSGQLLDQAIVELAVFDGQTEADRIAQRDVIRALRSGSQPSPTALLKQLPIAELVVANFPNWLHVSSQPKTLLAWRASKVLASNWSSKPSAQPSTMPAANSFVGYAKRAAAVFLLGLVSLVVLFKLTAALPSSFTKSAPWLRPTFAASAGYGARVAATIKPNIVFTRQVRGNPAVEIQVRTDPEGNIVERDMIKSSGDPFWDRETVKAIDRTAVLPKDVNGLVPAVFVIVLRPKD